ncbi:MAG: lipid-A-disaccharide synthase [Vulcanococcus sp.]
MRRLLISTGEVSGDLQGGLLVKALREEAQARQLELDVVALGGQRMRQAGATLLADTTAMGAIGLWEALPLVLPTLKVQRQVNRWLQVKRRLPKTPIFYYIAPQEWAFRIGEGGSTRLIGFTDRILAIFPEEARFYAARGAEVTWVGHPLLDTLTQLPSRQEAREQLGLKQGERLLLLFPASRKQELRYLLPDLAQAAAELQRRCPGLQVVVPAGQASFEPVLRELLEQAGVQARVIPAREADQLRPVLCAAADLALNKSGTVNLELALRGVPQVVVYRVSRPTAWVAKHLFRFHVDHISPVNLVLEERLVPELLQDEMTPDSVVQAALPLLNDAQARGAVADGYQRLRQRLGEPGVTRRAAAAILDALPER